MSTRTIRCKVMCSEITKTAHRDWSSGKVSMQDHVKFHPVQSGSEENKEFYKYTPGGMFDVHVTREGLFEIGKEYYVDFMLADEQPEKAS